MVAITVILAAVIGAFVLEIGDQQETAPSASFDSDEQVITMKGPVPPIPPADPIINETQVSMTHAGGDVLDTAQTELKVNGNPAVFGYDDDNLMDNGDDGVTLQPDIAQTLGTNERVKVSSGETMEAVAYGSRDPAEVAKDANTYPNNDYIRFNGVTAGWAAACHRVNTAGAGNIDVRVWAEGSPGKDCLRDTDAALLRQDDSVNIVWSSSSGGKTQALFRYTVQNTQPERGP
jgi:hypothetical protein